jgi:DNA-binding CsgD family transcriptional regulator/tetratricopeptide (TPR) repeat protein
MSHNGFVAAAPAFGLVGREGELDQLRAFARRLHAGPGAVLVRGDPGIGKTLLWRVAVAAAAEEGIRALVARCASPELPIPLGTVADLVEPVFDEVSGVLPDPQRRALAAALAIDDDGSRPDRLALPRALAATLRVLATDAPLLLAIDDVQWLDASSARVLAFALRRAGGARIGVLATLRGSPEEPEPLGLGDAFEPGAFAEVVLGPLSTGALQRLIRLRFDVRLPRPTMAAVHAASGGNPMFALEFSRTLKGEDQHARGPLPVPATLRELVRERVERLPADVRPLLELAAVLERPTRAQLGRALGEEEAERLVDSAVQAGALELGGDVVRFAHPLLASAVYFDMPTARRRALHADAAALLDDIVQRARHLALATTEPDAATARELDEAGAAAAARGATDAAAALASEAVRLTPPGDGAARIRRTFAGAGFLLEAGEVEAARARIEPLLEPQMPAAARAPALVLRAETEHRDRTLLLACLREAIEIAPDPRTKWHAWIRYAQHGGWVSGDAATAAAAAADALRIGVELGDVDLTGWATAVLAYYEAGRGRRHVEFAEADLAAVGRLTRIAPWQITPAISVGSRLLWAGELDRAREILRREHDELERHGSLLRLPLVLLPALVDLEWRAGRWDAAEAYVEEAREILEDALSGGGLVLLYARLLLAGSRGRIDEARLLGADGLRLTGQYHDVVNALRVRWALGHVEVAQGDAAAAWRTLEGLPGALEAFGIAEPGWQPILPDVVEALVALGSLDAAERALQQLEAQAAALAHGWAAPAALRCRALLLLAREQADEATAAAARAGDEFDVLGFPLDRARALLVSGAALRRTGQRRRAADALHRAIDVLGALPAPPWLELAHDELRRASPRPRRDRELTNAERRVAALAAEGLTNREIAARQFTTVGTVEAHLTRIYRKLGVRSRTQLARAVGDGALEDDG